MRWCVSGVYESVINIENIINIRKYQEEIRYDEIEKILE